MDQGININIEGSGGFTPPETYSSDSFIISGSTQVDDDFFVKYPETWPPGIYIKQHQEKDETRTYDCGGLPIDLTLPEKEFLRWDYYDHDYYQYLLDVTIETGNCEVGELAAYMKIACDMIEGM